jgi:hypothetical protein
MFVGRLDWPGSERDFDGHSHFHLLTPEQRLAWLSQAAQFWYTVHPGKRRAAQPQMPPRDERSPRRRGAGLA